jgi:hypothetical protein
MEKNNNKGRFSLSFLGLKFTLHIKLETIDFQLVKVIFGKELIFVIFVVFMNATCDIFSIVFMNAM